MAIDPKIISSWDFQIFSIFDFSILNYNALSTCHKHWTNKLDYISYQFFTFFSTCSTSCSSRSNHSIGCLAKNDLATLLAMSEVTYFVVLYFAFHRTKINHWFFPIHYSFYFLVLMQLQLVLIVLLSNNLHFWSQNRILFFTNRYFLCLFHWNQK